MVSALHICNSSLDIIRSDYDLSLLSIYLLVFNPILLKGASKRKVFKPHSMPSHSERRPVRSSGMYKAEQFQARSIGINCAIIYLYLPLHECQYWEQESSQNESSSCSSLASPVPINNFTHSFELLTQIWTVLLSMFS